MRPSTAKVIVAAPGSTPPELAIARALIAAVEKVAAAVGRPLGTYAHMGAGPVELADSAAFHAIVRADMEAHNGTACVTYRWGEGRGDFETITAVERRRMIMVIWLGEVEHERVVELSQRIEAAN